MPNPPRTFKQGSPAYSPCLKDPAYPHDWTLYTLYTLVSLARDTIGGGVRERRFGQVGPPPFVYAMLRNGSADGQ